MPFVPGTSTALALSGVHTAVPASFGFQANYTVSFVNVPTPISSSPVELPDLSATGAVPDGEPNHQPLNRGAKLYLFCSYLCRKELWV